MSKIRGVFKVVRMIDLETFLGFDVKSINIGLEGGLDRDQKEKKKGGSS